MIFSYTERAAVVGYDETDECHFVRHIFRDSENRRCTAFYAVSQESTAHVLADALNSGIKRSK